MKIKKNIRKKNIRKSRTRGEKMLFILEKVGGGVEDMADLFFAFLNAGYGASYHKIEYERDKMRFITIDEREKEKARRRFKSLLRYMHQQGLINKKKSGILKRTPRGKKRAKELKERKRTKTLPHSNYLCEQHKNLIIVAFDIPEKERHKRDWLRFALTNLRFKKIQQSLFVGHTKIPEEFLEDLRDLGIIENVAIFEVSRGGTLSRVD